jgi:hypothetical protein
LQEEDFKDQHHVGWDVMVVDVDRVDIIVLHGRVVVRLWMAVHQREKVEEDLLPSKHVGMLPLRKI